jgi:hypothetical protein
MVALFTQPSTAGIRPGNARPYSVRGPETICLNAAISKYNKNNNNKDRSEHTELGGPPSRRCMSYAILMRCSRRRQAVATVAESKYNKHKELCRMCRL